MDDDGVRLAPTPHLVGPDLRTSTVHGLGVVHSEDHPGTPAQTGQDESVDARNDFSVEMDDVGCARCHRAAERRECREQLPQSQGIETGASERLHVGAPPAAREFETGVTEPPRPGSVDGDALSA